jgi:hypothetical protein
MKSLSKYTVNIDPYEAGLEIGEGLKPIQPEVIMLFASVHYADFSEFFDGLYDGLGTDQVITFGGTGDGFFETHHTGNIGVSALGINGEGKIKWHVATEPALTEDPYQAGANCAAQIIKSAGADLKLAFTFAAMAVDGTLLADALRDVLKVPCIGGLTGDDRQYQRGLVLANGKMYENAVAILGCAGDIKFANSLGSGWKPVGEVSRVTTCNGNTIRKIGEKSALAFVKEQFGMPPTKADMSVITLAAYSDIQTKQCTMRSPYLIDDNSESITYFGSIPPETPVQVCFATIEDALEGVQQAIDLLPQLDFEPACALVISCAGRKWILGNRAEEELNILRKNLPENLPLIGYPSFGEISPHRRPDGSYTGAYFHNVTIVVTLLG